MAAVGRSTTAHEPDRAIVYRVGHLALLAWGTWQRQLPAGMKRGGGSPMWRDAAAGYRTTADGPTDVWFDEAEAAGLDRMIAAWLNNRDQAVLVCGYVAALSSRAAARSLSARGWPCTHMDYRAWLDAAVGRVDLLVDLEYSSR